MGSLRGIVSSPSRKGRFSRAYESWRMRTSQSYMIYVKMRAKPIPGGWKNKYKNHAPPREWWEVQRRNGQKSGWAGTRVWRALSAKLKCHPGQNLTSEVLSEISTHMDLPTAGSCPASAFFASCVTSGMSLIAKLN